MSDLNSLTGQEVAQRFGMVPLRGEGGMWAPIARSPYGNSISYLMISPDFSAWHRLEEDELWVSVAGAPISLITIDAQLAEHTLSHDSTPWHMVPAGTWMAAKSDGEWSLVVCSLAPPFSAMELATPEQVQALAEQYPTHAQQIRELIHD